jgi:hypothetical protein
MHFEGFSGIGFGLIFFALAGCVLAIAAFLLVPIALFGKPRRHTSFPYLGIAAVIEPIYFLGMGIFSWVFPESTAFDRLGALVWLPMPFLGLTFAAIGFFFSVRSDEKLVTAGAVAMVAIFALQGLMFLPGLWH